MASSACHGAAEAAEEPSGDSGIRAVKHARKDDAHAALHGVPFDASADVVAYRQGTVAGDRAMQRLVQKNSHLVEENSQLVQENSQLVQETSQLVLENSQRSSMQQHQDRQRKLHQDSEREIRAMQQENDRLTGQVAERNQTVQRMEDERASDLQRLERMERQERMEFGEYLSKVECDLARSQEELRPLRVRVVVGEGMEATALRDEAQAEGLSNPGQGQDQKGQGLDQAAQHPHVKLEDVSALSQELARDKMELQVKEVTAELVPGQRS